ncbi:uncharacterized protein SETTUDRAFT_33412 [Exserohilum turcica Et28A]|uniref:BZIP domain-containing protein n=1 Tax=Exserohilum turcicum (strain 28A) TaxID=671987 RepID=R0JPI6_EXST2|nr:uncharacterized protein SETTUDRAFT_33412 [Exserohilum turcica Et28A]EOA83083.1 hypothetical protein SETTUDRAFT_33412 [Exserohilum turcica Et28A]
MNHQMGSRLGPDGVRSQDDWKNMNDMIEKKKAQNRLAQRNYRRNVKRRIEELEQQVAMQAQLLAHESRTTKVSNQGASSVVASEVPPRVDESLNTAAREKQKDANVQLPTPTSQLFSTLEDSSRTDKLLDTLWYCHSQEDANEHKENLYGDLDNQMVDRVPISMRVGKDSQSRGETQGQPSRSESPTRFTDLDIGMLDDAHIRSSIDQFQYPSKHNQSREIEDHWCENERGSNSSGSISDKALLSDGDITFEQTIEGRVEYLIHCARRAGFQDLDSAVTTFYTAKFDEDSECSIAQYISRKRCLPTLLEELRSKSDSWKTREVQPYQDEVLKSAESLLLREMRSQQAVCVDKILFSLSSTDSGGGWGTVSQQFQEEVSLLPSGNQTRTDVWNSCLTSGPF